MRRMALAVAVLFTGWTVAVVPGGGGAERGWNFAKAVVGNAYPIGFSSRCSSWSGDPPGV
ncbi:hypothetical protein AVL48_26125 [Amycolatopsis regifaucium]|uniref:Uncharacterized protein n=2 Tax=Amycolatopsis regifaucium TaxID=546365 RepID=A0A154MRF7_9PSEU|nr:hypothetical protein AVL48_26125 [Amycolatopsis regifaucium]OKA03468.1 hypothetical protein ATP06_0235770 [Amycolatopsis regifaucium]SFJ14053.1 alpha-1,2-mannosyltransferase [Amycolatopsis regifaucium]